MSAVVLVAEFPVASSITADALGADPLYIEVNLAAIYFTLAIVTYSGIDKLPTVYLCAIKIVFGRSLGGDCARALAITRHAHGSLDQALLVES